MVARDAVGEEAAGVTQFADGVLCAGGGMIYAARIAAYAPLEVAGVLAQVVPEAGVVGPVAPFKDGAAGSGQPRGRLQVLFEKLFLPVGRANVRDDPSWHRNPLHESA